MTSPSAADIRTEREADKATATKNLPSLRAKRDELQREAGALGVVAQRWKALLIVSGAGATLSGLYALWSTVSESTSLTAWVLAAILSAVTSVLALRSKSQAREQAKHLDDLHKRMLVIGRRIDGAERRLRD